jgi:hypothetical protein
MTFLSLLRRAADALCQPLRAEKRLKCLVSRMKTRRFDDLSVL